MLSENDLRELLIPLECKGVDFGECVFMENKDVRVPGLEATVGPHVVFMMAFRWKQVPHPPDTFPPLKKLMCCSSELDPCRVCVNPYHWSMYLAQEMPYADIDDYNINCLLERFRAEEFEPYVSSLTTGGTREMYQNQDDPWCCMLYFEFTYPKSHMYRVSSSVINVLGETPYGTGFSLAALFQTPPQYPRGNTIRSKINQGLVIWKEDSKVWLYNRSDCTVYLKSPTLCGKLDNLHLYSCSPGYAIIIYYYDMAKYLICKEGAFLSKDKLMRINTIRVSFGKGWGTEEFRYTDIIHCPCWLEIYPNTNSIVEEIIDTVTR